MSLEGQLPSNELDTTLTNSDTSTTVIENGGEVKSNEEIEGLRKSLNDTRAQLGRVFKLAESQKIFRCNGPFYLINSSYQ